MPLREQAAREAFVYGVPAVALYRVLHDLVLAPTRTKPETSWNRLRSGRLPAGLGSLRGAGPPDGVPVHGWFDLRSGPVVVTTHPDAPGATASATFFDLYAEKVGRVSLEAAGPTRSLQLAGPSWDPVVSPDDAGVLRCRTDLCLAVGWVTPGADHERVRPLRPLLRIRLTDGGGPGPPLPSPVPPVDLLRPPTVGFLVVLDWMLSLMPAPPGFDDVVRRVEGRAGTGPASETRLARAARVLAGLRDGTPEPRRAARRPGQRPVR